MLPEGGSRTGQQPSIDGKGLGRKENSTRFQSTVADVVDLSQPPSIVVCFVLFFVAQKNVAIKDIS